MIAEGVETIAQAEFLLAEHCEEAQGFLYAKPLPAAEFENFLHTRQLASGDTSVKRLNRDANIQRRAGKPRSRRRMPSA